MSTQASHHIHLWNLPSSCPFFSPSLPTSFPFPPPRCPLPISPPLPHCPSLHLLLTLSPSALPTSSHPYCSPPHLTLPIAPFQIPPPCLHPPPPVAIHPSQSPSFLSTLPTSHFPLPPAFGPCQPSASFSPLPLPHRQLGSLIDSNQVCPTYQ